MESTRLEFAVKILAPELDQPETISFSGDQCGTTPMPASTGTGTRQTETDRSAGQDAEASDPVIGGDVSGLSLRELRLMCNQAFRDLDSEHPTFGAAARYEELIEEIRARAAAVRDAEPVEAPRVAFRDNVVFSRFESLHDGVLAAYLKYEMRGGKVWLLETVVQPQFRGLDLNVEAVLIRDVLLQAHRRRVTVVPVCNTVKVFLMEYPQYLKLIPAAERPAVELAATKAGWYGSNGI